MKYALLGARYLLGLILFVFGLNGFLNFLPAPELPAAAGAFLGALVEAGYVLPIVKFFEVVIGVLLLAGRFVPLALVMLVPISINIVALHVALDPAGGAPAYLVGLLNVALLFAHRDAFAPLLQAKTPATAPELSVA